MKNQSEEIAQFIQKRRIEKGITARHFAQQLSITAAYWCDIENNRRSMLIDYEKLDVLCNLLSMTKEERQWFFDCIAESRDIVPPDIDYYIQKNPHVIKALRGAIEKQAQENDWQDFIDRLDKRRE